MYNHTNSVFNNSCLKVPRNPKSDQPLPAYEQKYLNQLENQFKKLNLQPEDLNMKSKRGEVNKETIKSFLEFFGSIPEYDDINHLSNKEFYKKLENLKEKQKFYQEYLMNEIKFDCKDTEWIEDYKNLKLGGKDTKNKKKKTSLKPFCATPVLNKSNNLNKTFDIESIFSDKEVLNKPPSRRSVRIETPSDKLSTNITPEPNFRPKSRANISSAGSKRGPNDIDWDDISIENLNLYSDRNTPLPLETKSAPASPVKTKNTNWSDGITIPKPFQMTVRDEENKIVDELFIKVKKPKDEKPEQFKAHDIPIESQIPLFDKLMADQERRSFLIKERRKAALQAQMKPFSFTKRDEEIQELTREISKSSPNLYQDPPLKVKKFKAKPIPKNLFSNYIYKKMHEDEFYRAIQKKIRAEEMLKAASLPPSMAKRAKTKPKMDVCPRSFRDLNKEEKSPKKPKNIPNYKAYHDQFEKQLEELKNEFISTSPRPFKLKTSKRGKRHYRNSSASSKSSSTRTPSSLDFQSLNRSNLAAVLRIQSARQRLEMDMMKKLEEAKLKEEARWREKLMRKKPVWQALAYSHEEDLAMRLQLRKDEERLRNEEHRMRMEMMLGRVNQQPTLFERQSQVKFPKTREELIKELHREYGPTKNRKMSISDLSLVEMKDEAIQAFIDENFTRKSSDDTDGSKESENSIEEKEKCDCFSDENDKSNE
ncbi:protein FAM161A [Anoplophora glabripennis]|uniref:protein FAM161A n=2 Tax=Anoplophora glabripennis TaxID=217634 RepID=UPI000C7937F0|nr:protein FAM161A [Anoplophora glabripennis]